MSEMNEKAEEPQEQASDRPPLREVSSEELAKILEDHRKWVESEWEEGERANLSRAILRGADLFGAILRGADLQGANLEGGVQYLTPSQVKFADSWGKAFYSEDLIRKLGLPPDHNETVKKKLAELEKEKKGTGAK